MSSLSLGHTLYTPTTLLFASRALALNEQTLYDEIVFEDGAISMVMHDACDMFLSHMSHQETSPLNCPL